MRVGDYVETARRIPPRIRSGERGFITKVWPDGTYWVTHSQGGIYTAGKDDLIQLVRAEEAH